MAFIETDSNVWASHAHSGPLETVVSYRLRDVVSPDDVGIIVMGHRVGDFAVRLYSEDFGWRVDHIPTGVQSAELPSDRVAWFIADQFAIHLSGHSTSDQLEDATQAMGAWLANVYAAVMSGGDFISYARWRREVEGVTTRSHRMEVQ